MKTHRLAAAASTAVLSLGVLIACSPDETTAPARVTLAPVVFDIVGNPAAGQLEVCKQGTAATFTVTFGGNFVAGQVTGGITPAGGNSYTFGLTAGQCLTIYSRPVVAGVTLDPDVNATVVETAPVGGITFVSVSTTTESGNPQSTNQGARSGTVTWNMFHDARVTFVNSPPVVLGCTYTKGWYRNKGNPDVIAVDGRTKADAQAIFIATPGKPNGVTWGDDNNNLNLYQQLLAALQNLGGDAHALDGPPALDAAITAALAATGGTGKNITVAAGTDVSGLISVLSSFNEGTLAGGPAHCGEEVL
jgi:hypothetical protein